MTAINLAKQIARDLRRAGVADAEAHRGMFFATVTATVDGEPFAISVNQGETIGCPHEEIDGECKLCPATQV